jgi:catechol 2,3-dioxygenase-like lactoylglutathione lyase family enzyme
VRDLERSLAFYRDVLGLTVYTRAREQGEYIDKLVGIKNVVVEWVKLSAPDGGLIELLEYRSHPDVTIPIPKEGIPSNRLGSGHVALTVRDLSSLHARLVREGYACNSEPLIDPHGKVKILYCHDPDGIVLELIEDIR